MHVCAEAGNEQLFNYFLSIKGDYMSRNYADETPFHLAAREGKLNILQIYFDQFQFDIDHESMVNYFS
jgi:ankyrin repeat protein